MYYQRVRDIGTIAVTSEQLAHICSGDKLSNEDS